MQQVEPQPEQEGSGRVSNRSATTKRSEPSREASLSWRGECQCGASAVNVCECVRVEKLSVPCQPVRHQFLASYWPKSVWGIRQTESCKPWKNNLDYRIPPSHKHVERLCPDLMFPTTALPVAVAVPI
jgi:hypothetical protein